MTGVKLISRTELDTYLSDFLLTAQIKDYCPNGLQVQGRERISKIVSGVTASLALIEHAIALNADAILVHHGYFWRGEDMRVVGQKYKRLQKLLQHDINLFAYHLPLDIHADVGNNAQLAQRLGLSTTGYFGENNLGCMGFSNELKTVGDVLKKVEIALARKPICVGDLEAPVARIAWCTGAAQSFLGDAIAAGAQVFISGEISEPTAHLAREMGVAYIAAGHHATERYGVQALGQHLAQKFGIVHEFVDVDNPA